MKPIHTSLRLLLPAAAFAALGTCLAPLSLQGSPGHSSSSANYHTPAARVTKPDAGVSGQPYGIDAFGFATGGATYQPVSDLERLLNRAAQYYDRYHGQRRSNNYRNYGRSYRGYYPNDPDDRNNPRHPGYIGPPGSYPNYRSYPYRNGGGYYPNDPDDRNNPNHPDYIGPPGSSPYRRWWR